MVRHWSGVLKRKSCRSSEASVTMPMARSFGSWNWSQSRSSQNPRTTALRSSTVVRESSCIQVKMRH